MISHKMKANFLQVCSESVFVVIHNNTIQIGILYIGVWVKSKDLQQFKGKIQTLRLFLRSVHSFPFHSDGCGTHCTTIFSWDVPCLLPEIHPARHTTSLSVACVHTYRNKHIFKNLLHKLSHFLSFLTSLFLQAHLCIYPPSTISMHTHSHTHTHTFPGWPCCPSFLPDGVIWPDKVTLLHLPAELSILTSCLKGHFTQILKILSPYSNTM